MEPLAGYTVAITAERSKDELESLFAKRGARVVSAPTFRLVPLDDDTELRAVTGSLIADPPDIVVATTGIGWTSWFDAARTWGVDGALTATFSSSEILARGPKARSAVRRTGLREAWTPESESVAEVAEHLLSRDLRGRTVAIQLHGDPLDDTLARLRDAGATVIAVSVYRWVPPADTAAVGTLVRSIIGGEIDAVVFTSQPAVEGLFAIAHRSGLEDALTTALQSGIVVACVGPLCATPLQRRGIGSVVPDSARLAPLVRSVTEQVPLHRARRSS